MTTNPETIPNTEEDQRKIFEKEYAKAFGLEQVEPDEQPPEPETPQPEAKKDEPPNPAEKGTEGDEDTVTPEPTETPDEPQAANDTASDLKAEWDKLPETIKNAILEERQREHRQAQAAIGRTAYLNRELDNLRKKVAQYEQQQQPPNTGRAPAPPQTAPVAVPTTANLTQKQWDKLRNDDPELASAITEALEDRDRRLVEAVQSQWTGIVSPLDQKANELELRLEEVVLDTQMPHWRQAVSTPEWQQWVQFLPPDERAVLPSLRKAKDLLPYIARFTEDYNAYIQSRTPAPTPSQTPPAITNQPTELADKVAQDRAKKLQQPTAGPASPPRQKADPVLDPNDPEAMRRLFEKNLELEYKRG